MTLETGSCDHKLIQSLGGGVCVYKGGLSPQCGVQKGDRGREKASPEPAGPVADL